MQEEQPESSFLFGQSFRDNDDDDDDDDDEPEPSLGGVL